MPPFLYSGVVAITVDSKHAFYSFVKAVRALFKTKASAKGFVFMHFTYFKQLKLFKSEVAFALTVNVFSDNMESAFLRVYAFYTEIFLSLPKS